MFDVDRFVADCRSAAAASGSPGVLDVVANAVANPAEVLKVLEEPHRAAVQVLHRSAEMTVFNLIWGPRMCQLPHNHGMWAIIGIYTGREDNIFWRRPADVPDGRIEAAGARALSERDAIPLGRDIIHSVINPIKRLTGAIHVYGGDFFAVSRSEWDPEHLVEGDPTTWKKRWLSSRSPTVCTRQRDVRRPPLRGIDGVLNADIGRPGPPTFRSSSRRSSSS